MTAQLSDLSHVNVKALLFSGKDMAELLPKFQIKQNKFAHSNGSLVLISCFWKLSL